ncbi:endonuclease MutS2, partial [Chloroflexota bacterium]
MDIKSLEILEFPQIREILAWFTSFTPSRELALDLQPLSDYDRISLLLRQSAEARHLLSLQPNLSIGGVVDIREAVKMAARGSVLDPGSLLEIQHTLAALSQLRGRIGKISEDYPLLWDIAKGIAEFPHVESDIATCIAPTGELLDTASPKLSALRHQLKEATQDLMEKLESIIREPVITIREGRYVIPIKIESRSRMKGIVHDISNTEATAFIEPWSTVELGNTVRELKIEERHEVERILRDLSTEIGTYEADILHSIALTAELDLVLAKARYAHKVRANEPIVTTFSGKKTGNDPVGMLRLVEARHPLLGEKAVPLSVEIGQDFSIMVITGPNTGGKTVALKTIGLLSLMAQAGLPIPASDKCCIPMFDGVFADIGDEQSIAQTLSSFSWHINNIIRIIDTSTDRSLVLVDELGTSTDPAEGAALARSILLHFLSRRTVTLATSHFNELKAFAHATEGMQNASLDFDQATLTPTYHLMVGIPGGSNALATAARLGLPARIIEGARKMLSHGMQELETLLGSLMGEKQRIETLRNDLEKELEEATWRNKELEGEIQQLRGQEQRAIQESRDK